jgi:hypothetical protein
MADKVLKRFVDAGVQFTGVTPTKAEALVRKLVSDGEVRRRDAEKTIAAFVGKGRDTAESVVVRVQRELSAQLDRLSARVDEVEHRLEDLVGTVVNRTTGAPGPTPTPAAASAPVPAKKAAAKKAPAKKAAAKKAAAKKAPAKKTAAKRAPAKKAAAAKKAPAKEAAVTTVAEASATATGPSGVRRVDTTPH